MIYCVAIIGPKNSPLYFKTYQGVVVLNMQFVVHAALDVLDEKRMSLPTLFLPSC